jgi:DNA invertase Pin-like site-specific DNA recombinase
MFEANNKITNALNYLRKSRQDVQREKLTGEDTLASQKKLMANVLDQYGIPYEQRMEIGSGDKISTRPVFQEVLEELKSGKYDAIAVKEISRLGRGSYADMGTIHDVLMDYGIRIITPHKVYDLTNPADNRQFRFETFMSREEFETTRERLVGARYTSAMEGKWMGNVPFGYTRNEKTLRLEPIEEEAKIVKLIYDLYINGYEGKIVKEKIIKNILENHKIPTAKNCKIWDTTQIKRILTNDAYMGVSKFRTTKVNSQGKQEPRPIS